MRACLATGSMVRGERWAGVGVPLSSAVPRDTAGVAGEVGAMGAKEFMSMRPAMEDG